MFGTRDESKQQVGNPRGGSVQSAELRHRPALWRNPDDWKAGCRPGFLKVSLDEHSINPFCAAAVAARKLDHFVTRLTGPVEASHFPCNLLRQSNLSQRNFSSGGLRLAGDSNAEGGAKADREIWGSVPCVHGDNRPVLSENVNWLVGDSTASGEREA